MLSQGIIDNIFENGIVDGVSGRESRQWLEFRPAAPDGHLLYSPTQLPRKSFAPVSFPNRLIELFGNNQSRPTVQTLEMGRQPRGREAINLIGFVIEISKEDLSHQALDIVRVVGMTFDEICRGLHKTP